MNIFVPILSAALALGFFQGQLSARATARELVALPRGIEHFTFGAREVVADLGWLRSIQDFDYCETKEAVHRCRGNGWLARMLDVVTDLSPRFRAPYSSGGMALSIIISDREGATRLFEKGLAQYPDDWVLSYKAAYHFLYEESDPGRAARLMENAAKHGAPDWVYSLAGRLYTQAGQRELAARLLQDARENSAVAPEVLERLEARVRANP